MPKSSWIKLSKDSGLSTSPDRHGLQSLYEHARPFIGVRLMSVAIAPALLAAQFTPGTRVPLAVLIKRAKDHFFPKIAEKKRLYREEHKEEIAEKKRLFYQERKEEIAEKQRLYREEHKEEIAEKQRLYREEHKEELAEKKRLYREEHRERYRNYMKSYRKSGKIGAII
jgi:hypothetical protein